MLNKKNKLIKFSSAINYALDMAMAKNENVILFGLGAEDPKRVFGTLKNLKEKYKNRVFDIPTSENAITGIALGASINGLRPVLSHQRVEFSLLSLEQIINQISKWSFMNNGKKSASLVIRLVIGRGWGQGPQHSQSLESNFAHVPGLKVVSPSNPKDAKGMLISSIEDKNPVIFFEHRWLHEIEDKVPLKYYKVKIGEPKICKYGKQITLVSYSYMLNETLKAAKILENHNINCEVIDLNTLRPLNIRKILKSVKKTKKILFIDNGYSEFGIGSEVISKIVSSLKETKNFKFHKIGILGHPIASTRALAKYSYIDYKKIILKIKEILKSKKKIKYKDKNTLTDVPNLNFKGPF